MRKTLLIICIVSGVWFVSYLIRTPQEFFRSYLVAYLYWLSLTMGSFAMLMTYHLTGGHWGKWTKAILEAAVRLTPIMALLILPVLLHTDSLFPWAHNVLLESHSHKALYFNPTFFTMRAIVYFLCWIGIALGLTGRPRSPRWLSVISGGGLVPLGFTLTFAAIDWQMSVDPLWYSTIYGMVFAVGQTLAAWAFAIVVMTFLLPPAPSQRVLRDIGNLLLMLVILWTYVSFMQYLVVWSGNLPDEVTWYVERTTGGWQVSAVLVAVCQFAIPFTALLFRDSKHRIGILRAVALWILIARMVEQHWLVAPAFYPGHFHLALSDVAAWISLGALWLWLFLGRLRHQEILYA